MTDLSEERVYARHQRRTGAVLIVGAGAVGGFLAVELARLGISPIVLVDHDVLAVENLVRHPLGAEELGKHKASALASRIRREFPLCDATGYDVNFLQLPPGRQQALAREAPVVIAATDSAPCQRRINEVCIATETIAVYPGVWVGDHVRDAEVGEIQWVLPGRHTPCYLCATSWRPEGAGAEARGGTRADIQVLVLALVWVVAGLINPDDERARMLDPERTLILVHGFMQPSRAVEDLFSTSNMTAIRVPFPQRPCEACGGQQPRPQPPARRAARAITPAQPTPTHRGRVWSIAWVVAIAVLLIGVVITLTHHGSASAGAAGTSPSTTPPSYVPTKPLPVAVSATFSAEPTFNGGAPVSAIERNGYNEGPVWATTTFTPTLRRFTLVVDVSVHYTAFGLRNDDGSVLDDFRVHDCLNIDGSMASGNRNGPTEMPLETHLSVSGPDITGYLVYAAVLPGFYVPCNGDVPVSLGRVTTPNLGVSYGGGPGNSLVVFAEHTSQTDTVLSFGAIGETGDHLSPAGVSCIVPASQNSNRWKPDKVVVVRQQNGGSPYYPNSSFEVGTLTFDRTASEVSAGWFIYSCAADDWTSEGVALAK